MPDIEFDCDPNSFQKGFMFAQNLIAATGQQIDDKAIFDLLGELSEGTSTLGDSPLDTIAKIEARHGKPLPDNLKETVHQMASDNRKELAEYHRHAADCIIAMWRNFVDEMKKKRPPS